MQPGWLVRDRGLTLAMVCVCLSISMVAVVPADPAAANPLFSPLVADEGKCGAA
jgi:hypothetical protein